MHTRRTASAIVGAWLVGIVLMWFVTGQTVRNVERALTLSGPAALSSADPVDREPAGRLLLHGATLLSRRITESWEMLQIGLGAALVASALVTRHRSRTLIVCAVVMTAAVAVQGFVVTPAVTRLQLHLPADTTPAALADAEALRVYEGLHMVLEAAKMLAGVVLAVRLLVDWRSWRAMWVMEDAVTPGRRRA